MLGTKPALLSEVSLSLIDGRLCRPRLSVLQLNPWPASAAIRVSTRSARAGRGAKVETATAEQARAIDRYGAVARGAFREVESALANEAGFRNPPAHGGGRPRNDDKEMAPPALPKAARIPTPNRAGALS